MWPRAAAFFLLGLAARPLVTSVLRPLLREVVKAGVLATSQMKQVAADAMEEWEDINAEVDSREPAPRPTQVVRSKSK